MLQPESGIRRPRRLYHFTSFNPERLSDLLLRNRVYCSNPSDFNDPWDCKVHYYIPHNDETEIYERYITWLEERWLRNPQKKKALPEGQSLSKILRGNKEYVDFLVEKISAQMETTIQSVYRVFCLSKRPDNTLLWSHYARSHTGICLEFDTSNEVFSCATRVRYSETFPVYLLSNDEISDEVVPLVMKSNVWEYEQEYRLVAADRAAGPHHVGSLRSKRNFLSFPARALVSIIIGCRFGETNLDALKAVVRRRYPSIILKCARRVPNRYDLLIEPL